MPSLVQLLMESRQNLESWFPDMPVDHRRALAAVKAMDMTERYVWLRDHDWAWDYVTHDNLGEAVDKRAQVSDYLPPVLVEAV